MATRSTRLLPTVMSRALALLALPLLTASTLGAAGTLHLERCAGGCVYTPGFDNSCLNRSSIVSQTSSISAFEHGEPAWQELVACVQRVLDPYDVAVTDIDPGCTTPHWELVVAGTPGQIGQPPGVAGVSPFTCDVILNAPAFAFANLVTDMRELCWTVTHEFAHLLGADHELLQRDPMTYLDGCLVKRFAAAGADCGESTPRACCTGSSTQDSDALLISALGPRAGGLVFPGSFEAWDPVAQSESGSTCHWDQVVGAQTFAEPAAGALAGPRCGTVTVPD